MRLLCFYLVYPAAKSSICNIVRKRSYVTVELSEDEDVLNMRDSRHPLLCS